VLPLGGMYQRGGMGWPGRSWWGTRPFAPRRGCRDRPPPPREGPNDPSCHARCGCRPPPPGPLPLRPTDRGARTRLGTVQRDPYPAGPSGVCDTAHIFMLHSAPGPCVCSEDKGATGEYEGKKKMATAVARSHTQTPGLTRRQYRAWRTRSAWGALAARGKCVGGGGGSAPAKVPGTPASEQRRPGLRPAPPWPCSAPKIGLPRAAAGLPTPAGPPAPRRRNATPRVR